METLTTDTTTVTYGSNANCNLSIGNDMTGQGSITALTPGTVYEVFISCLNCCIEVTTKPEAVRNLTVTDVTTTSLLVTWTEPEGESSLYRVNWTNGQINTTGTSRNISGLTAGVKYCISVTAVANDNRTEGQSTTDCWYTQPGKIGSHYESITNSSIYLNWTQPPGEVFKYRVNWHNGGTVMSNYTKSTFVVLPELIPGTSYTIQIIAVNGANESGEPYTFTSVTKPAAVRGLAIIGTTSSSVSLNWTEPEGNATSYIVRWTAGDNSKDNTTETFFTINDLIPGYQYIITVVAVAVNPSNTGEERSKPTFTRPVKPVDITVGPRGTDNLNISWTLPKGRVDHYVVTISNDKLMYANNNTTKDETFLFTGLHPGRVYDVMVTAVAGNFKETSDKSSFATYPTPPGPLDICHRTNSSLCVGWLTPALMENAPNISYHITYSSDKDPGVHVYYSYLVQWVIPAGTHNDTVSNYRKDLSDLEPGTKYNISVRTIAAQGIESADEFTFCYTRPTAVPNITVESVTTTSVQLSWPRQSDHKPSYSYLVMALRDTTLVHNGSTKNETYTFSDLCPGGFYTFKVITEVDGVKSSEERKTSYTRPALVSDIVIMGNTTSLSVSWSAAECQLDSYTVLLHRDGELVGNSTDLSNTTENHLFVDLKPGVLYCVEVVTKSGPFQNKSAKVCDAIFPNPPGTIMVESQTVDSINFTWSLPENMEDLQYNFSVSSTNGSVLVGNSWFLLTNLQSGCPHSISVVTVGVGNYESSAVTAQNYTRPYPVTVRADKTEITTNTVTLVWEQQESKCHLSYVVQVSNGAPSQTVNTTKMFTGLSSGSNYSFTVTTQTADGTQAAPVTVSYFTRPYGIRQLQAETLNTTAVRLFWNEPLEYKPEYTYRVETARCATHKNKTLTGNDTQISELTPGTECSFCVVVRAADGIEGEAYCTLQYTRPETVLASISSQGSNSSVLVSWTKPRWRVEHFKVYLKDTFGADQERQLNSSDTFFLFDGLSAGRIYSAVVTTLSGPFEEPSGFVTNATFPNPPGMIEVLKKTTSSLHIKWEEAPLMDNASFSYQLSNISAQGGEHISTNNTYLTFTSLQSGTPYNISVATVGVLGFQSATVQINMVTTRPFKVNSLNTSEDEEIITATWLNPDQYKESYRFYLTLQSLAGHFSDKAKDNQFTFTKLDPGSRYNLSVTTETFDGTQSDPTLKSICTKASPVTDLKCEGPNKPKAEVVLSWSCPRGVNSGFKVSVDDILQSTVPVCNHTVSNLRHYTEYKLTVETQSCGRPSSPQSAVCWTGITDPPTLENNNLLVKVQGIEHNKFSLQINSSRLNNTNGPVTYVGVLVTAQNLDTSDFRSYLGKTYTEWKAGDTQAYLATVKETNFKTRSGESQLNIEVGDDTTWKGYTNGALQSNGKYQFAIVLFTDLNLKKQLVNVELSLVSITQLSTVIYLPINSAVIGLAAGATLGIFFILFIILIGFIFYWKRKSNKESPDIQIHSMSAAVRVEDFEAYYKKQTADSNCGFAEEFEDLKAVGTGQPKTIALAVENKPKNRYNNVLPYDSSRVKLSIIHGSPFDDYINANYTPGYNSSKEFIAAQGPLPHTVNEFWRMIWEKNVQTLVMLTRCNEQGRVKCEQYWEHGTKHFENIIVTETSKIPLKDWTIIDFNVKNVKTAETRSLRHFHLTAWPDHGVPETTELLISFRHLVREHMDQYSRHSPAVVHCSAGVGRTGTFIAIDHLIFQIERENMVDVFGIVHNLRMHRPLMVQTEDQYVFLNHCAMDIIRSRTGTNVDLIYQNTAALSIYENVEPKKGFPGNGYYNA
ncbi:receptor-type tyrosine-protein phosphatase eta-like [Tautogolabrus adspersus]